MKFVFRLAKLAKTETIFFGIAISALMPGGLPVAAQTFVNETATAVPGLPGLFDATVAWADYDNDGDMDFLIAGAPSGAGNITQLWKNNNDGTFEDVTTTAIPGLPGLQDASVAWADYDSDGYLDFMIMGYAATEHITQLRRNKHDGTFEDVNAALPAVGGGSIDWADYDNDGDLDFLMAGASGPEGYISQLRTNNNNTFEDAGLNLTGVAGISSVAWADWDNDDDQDFLMTGYNGGSGNSVSQLWKNNADGTFENANVVLPGLQATSATWADYDNDGDMDFLITGSDGGSNIAQFWKNNNGTFTDVTSTLMPGLPQVREGSVAWADYDNDGDLDFVIMGITDTQPVAQLWENHIGIFTNVTAAEIPGLQGVYRGKVAWADYDNDGDQDFIIMGWTSIGTQFNTQLWKNNGTVTNQVPGTPAGLTSGYDSKVMLSWNAATDAETPAAALTYNARIGTAPGSDDVMGAEGNLTTGRRHIPAHGNAEQGTGHVINNLPVGTYYWSVQAVDNAFAGGPWADEEVFHVVNTAPTFVKGDNITVNEGAGPQTFNAWATIISPGASNESDQLLSFETANDNNDLFTVQPDVDVATGDLTFTAAPDAYGIATVTLVLKDDGGTANGGEDRSTKNFTITINNINDAPSFTKGADVFVNEDAPAQTIVWATDVSAGLFNEADDQTLTFNISNNTNTSLFSSQPVVDASGTLMFTPTANVYGSAEITISLKDNGGTDLGGVDESTSQAFTITINSVNDAPSFTKGADITVQPGVSAQSIGNWATAISAGPANEASQVLIFTISNDGLHLFSIQPVVDASGTLTFTPAPEQYGSAIVTLILHDDGGTANGGVDQIEQTFVITMEEPLQVVFLPNFFSPNSDGSNDVFRVRGYGIDEILFRVYNVHGQEVFSTDDVITATDTGWNGRYDGKDMPAGTYTWTLQGKYKDGKPLTSGGNQYGQVILMR